MGRVDDGMKCIRVRTLTKKGAYDDAMEVIETININKVRSIVDLKVIAGVLERVGEYRQAKEVMLRSYDLKRTKMTVYRLAYLSIKTGEFADAEEFYQEFSELAPNSADRYILRYGIDRAKNVDYMLRIATLQKLKQIEYTEEWGYELAKIYHKAGLHEECINECKDLAIWFGSGVIVEKAKLLCKYHEEGRESLDEYGVFEQDMLSEEELEEKRSQFRVDTADFGRQVVNVEEQAKEQELRRQIDLDFEKTVDLRQVLANEGEDFDLLKKEVHRVWGAPEEEQAAYNVQGQQEATQEAVETYEMDSYPMYQDETEAMIAASLAEVMEEQHPEQRYEPSGMEEILPDELVEEMPVYIEEELPKEELPEEEITEQEPIPVAEEPVQEPDVAEEAPQEEAKEETKPGRHKRRNSRRAEKRRKKMEAAKQRAEERKAKELEQETIAKEYEEEPQVSILEQEVSVSLKEGSEFSEAAILQKVLNKMSKKSDEVEEAEVDMPEETKAVMDEIVEESLKTLETSEPQVETANTEEEAKEADNVEATEEELEEALEQAAQEALEEKEEKLLEDLDEMLEELEKNKEAETPVVELEEQPEEEKTAEEHSEEEADEETAEEEEHSAFIDEYGMLLWEYFMKYQQDTRLCEDVYGALEKAKSGKRPMNFIITCKSGQRAAELGCDLGLALKALELTQSQVVARISAEKLNRMHLEQQYDRIKGGCLMVEDAKKMTADTAQSIMNMINELGDEIVVILCDARPFMMDLLNEYSMMKRYFPFDIAMR